MNNPARRPGSRAPRPATGSVVAPLVRESTPSLIAEKLRSAIGHGDIAPGAQLFESELARQLGVSRGPLREGLQRLTQEGLLVSIRNRGVFVIEMTPDNITDMYQARSAIERAAAQQVLRRDPVAASRALVTITDKMASARRLADRSERDLEFHEELVAQSGSPRLQRIHTTLLTETRMCIHALEETYGLSDGRVAEHRAIARAIGASDAALTDRLMLEHMNDALSRLAGPDLIS